MTDDFLPYGQQYIDDEDILSVVDILKSPYLTTGPAVNRFELAFAEITGARQAVVCANGTAALHIGAMALDLEPGDVVVVPAVTFLATANAARYIGAEVVFADVDAATGLMMPEHLDAAIARAPKRPKAVFPVHLGGPCCDMPELARIAAGHGLQIMEDACHALGTTGDMGGRAFKAGDCAWSDLAIFSTHPVKMLTMGEGGVVTLNDDVRAERLRRLRSHGMTRELSQFTNKGLELASDGSANTWYYEMHEVGYNYRATDMQCALGLSQLRKMNKFVERRRALVARYRSALKQSGLASVSIPVPDSRLSVGWHLFRVSIDFKTVGKDRQQVMKALRSQGVGSQVLYIPLYHQPYYRDRYGTMSLPGAERYYERTLALPLFYSMKDSDVDRVVNALSAALH